MLQNPRICLGKTEADAQAPSGGWWDPEAVDTAVLNAGSPGTAISFSGWCAWSPGGSHGLHVLQQLLTVGS